MDRKSGSLPTGCLIARRILDESGTLATVQ